MPRKTRKRVKPKGRGNSIKFKHRLVRGGSIPKNKRTPGITKVSRTRTPVTARGWSMQSALERKKNQKVLNVRGSTTQASPALLKSLEGRSRSPKTIMGDLQKTRKEGGPRMEGGRKTRKKGNKSMKRRC